MKAFTPGDPDECVIVLAWWKPVIRFHRRQDSKPHRVGCNNATGHPTFLPRRVAERVASPCHKCWP